MRLLRLALPLLAVAALLGAESAGAGAARTVAAPKVIKLISVTTKADETDKPPAGASKGDRTIGASRLYNAEEQFGKKKGVVVGSDKSVFLMRSATILYANGTATLPGGTIHFQGNAKVSQGVFLIPVVSGTGDFVGAKGTLLIPLAQPGTTVVPNVYQLTYVAVA